MAANNTGTYTLTTSGGPTTNGVYVFPAQSGVTYLCLKLNSGGAATILGGAECNFLTGSSNSIALVEDEPTLFTNQLGVSGLTVTVTSGTVTALIGLG